MTDIETVKARYPDAELRKVGRFYTVWKSPTACAMFGGKIGHPMSSQKKAWASARAIVESAKLAEGSTKS